MANPEYVLEMRDIVKVFPGVRALDGVKLQIRPGKVHVICGENGAGKSTLMKIINGTYVADEGEMIYKGEKIGPHTVQDTLKMGIAMIYQELNPVLEMTVAENIWLGREPRKGKFVDFGKMQKNTQELLDRLDMPYKATQKMYELSIAGHQLVEIAKAISCNASVIIMKCCQYSKQIQCERRYFAVNTAYAYWKSGERQREYGRIGTRSKKYIGV